jgi:hypothetical protein
VSAFPDVVVLIPGVSGSALAKNGQEIWSTSGGALWRAMTSGGGTIRQLAMGEDDPSVDDLGDGVEATRLIPDLHMIPGLWKIDGYTATSTSLLRDLYLRAGQNYFEFPYDWRRDNRVSARRLQRATERWLRAWRSSSGNDNAKLVLIGHSMGGVVARYFLEVLQGWRDTRTLVTFGTPYRGSLNAVGFLANGYAKRVGPLNLDFSETIRTFTSLYQLLPTYPCIDKGDGRLVRVDETKGLPNTDPVRAGKALAFHHEVREAQAANSREETYRSQGYTIFPIVGIEQPTFQSAALVGGKLELRSTLEGKDDGGDGTVPRASATPIELSTLRREMYAAEAHASLQNFAPVLTQVVGVLGGNDIDWDVYEVPASLTTLGLDLQDAYAAGPLDIEVKMSAPVSLAAVVFDAATSTVVLQAPLRPFADRQARASIALPAGTYRVTICGDKNVSPVTDTFLVI